MLEIIVPGVDLYDEDKQEFVEIGPTTLELEHSLAALSKWESIYEKPFLNEQEKTADEVVGYIKAMTLTPKVPEEVYLRLSTENFETIDRYINAKMTATWFSDVEPETKNSEIITSELLYYWMSTFQIPFEAEAWHLNRLFTLIKICSVKASKPKKMSRQDQAARNRALNAQRKQKHNTSG